MIYVDTRERKEKFSNCWQTVTGLMDDDTMIPQYVRKCLHNGDYLLDVGELKMLIERKEIRDFNNSIKKDKDGLKQRFARMRKDATLTMLLVEGSTHMLNGYLRFWRNQHLGYINGISYKTYCNFIMSQQMMGTMFYETVNFEDTVRFIIDTHNYLSNLSDSIKDFIGDLNLEESGT